MDAEILDVAGAKHRDLPTPVSRSARLLSPNSRRGMDAEISRRIGTGLCARSRQSGPSNF